MHGVVSPVAAIIAPLAPLSVSAGHQSVLARLQSLVICWTIVGCKRENVTVEAGKTYRIRMINAGSLAYLTVCFANHNVTIVAADAYPTNPLTMPCVDINLGQRCALHRVALVLWLSGPSSWIVQVKCHAGPCCSGFIRVCAKKI